MSDASWTEEQEDAAFGPSLPNMIAKAELIARWLGPPSDELDYIGYDEIVVMAQDLHRDLRRLAGEDVTE